MQELGLASHASILGGLVWKLSIPPNQRLLLNGTSFGVLIDNQSVHQIAFQLECQVLTKPAQELMKIANPPPTNLDFLKALAQRLFEKIRGLQSADLLGGKINVLAVSYAEVSPGQFHSVPFYKATMPGQTSA